MMKPTPTQDSTLPRRFADFESLVDALDYAASGLRGINFYSARGELTEVLPYSVIRDRAQEIGLRLVKLGLEKGSRVALIADTSSDFICFFLGCQYASVLPVPLPLPTSFGGRDGYTQQLNRQIQSCNAAAVITPEPMYDLIASATEGIGLRFVGSCAKFMTLSKQGAKVRLPKSDDLAYLQYSSGSTRFPHGISVTHKSLMSNCYGMCYIGMQLTDNDRCVSWLPFYHDMGLVGTFLTSLASQSSVDYIATEDFARRPMTWLTLISRNRGTITYSPTFGYDLCARRAGPDSLAKLDLSCLRAAGIGGDMIRPDVMRHFAETFAPVGFQKTAFVPSYGLAECTLAVSFMPLNKGIVLDKVEESVLSGEKPITARRKSSRYSAMEQNGHHFNGQNGPNGNRYSHNRLREVVNCGIPLPEYEIEIRDEDGFVLAERNIGQVFVKGPSVMREYFDDPESTKQVLSDDGWLDTGDMGYMLDGHLYIVGRIKDMIIVNGRNHWPQDIEWAVERLPGIRSGDIAAISIPGIDDEEVPLVLVQCRLSDPEEREEFKKQVKYAVQQASGIACNVELIPPRTLPRTSSGKLSRSKARAQYITGGISPLLN